MRIVYMGTPDFAVPCLERLAAEGHQIVLVVCQPDKPVGRKQILTPCDVKVKASELGLEVYQPASLRTDEAYSYISSKKPDLTVVAAYGKILPKNVLDIPTLGCVNVHGSLLPRYRGASPIQSAVLAGEKVTGVTTMLMDEGLDTGDILLSESVEICPEETSGELFDRLASLAPELLIKTINGLADGSIKPVKQNDAEATFTGLIRKEDARVDWSASAQTIHDLIRGMSPWPAAFTMNGDKRVKLWSSRLTDETAGGENGDVTVRGDAAFVRCGDGRLLRLLELQEEGAKKMDISAFLKGHGLKRFT